MRAIVLTSPPGVGRTALLNALRARGHEAADESARAFIEERPARGLSPRPAPLSFDGRRMAGELRANGGRMAGEETVDPGLPVRHGHAWGLLIREFDGR